MDEFIRMIEGMVTKQLTSVLLGLSFGSLPFSTLLRLFLLDIEPVSNYRKEVPATQNRTRSFCVLSLSTLLQHFHTDRPNVRNI